MSNTLLVTGGAGFIGSNFIHYWLTTHPEDQVINFDALTYAGNEKTLADVAHNPRYHFVKGDIRHPQAVQAVMSGIDFVVHFAAETHVDRSILEPAVFLETNILGTQVLLEAALKAQVKRFHHISTDEVFGTLALNTSDKFDENTAYDPHSPYSASKAGSDHLVRAYGDTYGLPFTISNCSNNYGEFHFPEKMIPLAITNLMENKAVPVYGDGFNVRDWLYVQDHCAAIAAILSHGQTGETYLVGGMVGDISNLDLVKLLIKQMGKSETLIEMVKDRPGHDRRYAVNWTHINQALGWSPKVTLEEGLQKTIDWYDNNRSWWEPLKQNTQSFFKQNYDSKTDQEVT